MTWRVAQLNLDALSPDVEVCFGSKSVSPQASEISVFGQLRQRFCSDEELAGQLQNGNADALTVLFKRYSTLVFGIARRILRNDAEAEDAVQQTFLDVFRSIHQFDPEKGTFKTWLLLFAYQRTFNRRRSQVADRFFDTDALDTEVVRLKSVSAWARGYSPAENGLLVEQVLKSLQPRQRRTIELIYCEGMTADEVSLRTGESVRVVRHNLYRGLDKLRKAFCDPGTTKPAPKGGSR